MNWKMTEVKGASEIRRFLDLPKKIYQGDANWIQPLDKDIEEVFDVKKNKLFKTGICSRWILEDERSQTIGRVAAFVNKKYKQEQATGGIGFFEVINNEKATHFMLDFCKDWLQNQGMEAMDGPINFGERDRFWGLVTEGYSEPLYGMNYNPPYYKTFFESYGFQVYFYQECYGLNIANQLQAKFYERHDLLSQNKDLKAQRLEKKDWKKYARDFAYVYNKAWAAHGEGKSLDERQAIKIFKSMRPVMDERINWFIYDKGEAIAFWINLPDLNQYFKYLHGKFGILQKLYFLWLKKFKTNTKIIGIVFGIDPKWQGMGMDAFMIVEGTNVFLKESNYQNYEMQWIGDFNPKMINIAKSLGATVSRRLATYRYLFDRTKPFERHPILS